MLANTFSKSPLGLLEDILPRWTEGVIPQVHDGRVAQIGQTLERGWTSEESLAYMRRLLAISAGEEEPLEEKGTVGIEPINLGRSGVKLE